MIHILIFYLPAKGFRWSGSINGRINLSLRDKSLNWKQKEKKKKMQESFFFFLICLCVIMYFVIFTIVFIILFSIFVLFAVCCLA